METFESDVFEASGHKWKLRMYPNGNTLEDGRNYISLYLLIVETSILPKGWDFHAYFKFFIYDHIQDNYLTIQDGMKRRFHEKKLEWGFAKVISLNTLKDDSSGFLFQDTCVIGAEVLVTPKFVQKENCLSMIKPPVTNNSFTWTIDNYSDIRAESVYSEEFKVGKLKWKMKLYPNGNSGSKNIDLSLYLVVSDYSSFPLGWKCYGKFKCLLKDQVGHNHIEKEASNWFCDERKDWGFTSFVPLHELTGGLKVDNTIIIEAQISLVGTLRNFT